jgi:hypothetical protein
MREQELFLDLTGNLDANGTDEAIEMAEEIITLMRNQNE